MYNLPQVRTSRALFDAAQQVLQCSEKENEVLAQRTIRRAASYVEQGVSFSDMRVALSNNLEHLLDLYETCLPHGHAGGGLRKLTAAALEANRLVIFQRTLEIARTENRWRAAWGFFVLRAAELKNDAALDILASTAGPSLQEAIADAVSICFKRHAFDVLQTLSEHNLAGNVLYYTLQAVLLNEQTAHKLIPLLTDEELDKCLEAAVNVNNRTFFDAAQPGYLSNRIIRAILHTAPYPTSFVDVIATQLQPPQLRSFHAYAAQCNVPLANALANHLLSVPDHCV